MQFVKKEDYFLNIIGFVNAIIEVLIKTTLSTKIFLVLTVPFLFLLVLAGLKPDEGDS